MMAYFQEENLDYTLKCNFCDLWWENNGKIRKGINAKADVRTVTKEQREIWSIYHKIEHTQSNKINFEKISDLLKHEIINEMIPTIQNRIYSNLAEYPNHLSLMLTRIYITMKSEGEFPNGAFKELFDNLLENPEVNIADFISHCNKLINDIWNENDSEYIAKFNKIADDKFSQFVEDKLGKLQKIELN